MEGWNKTDETRVWEHWTLHKHINERGCYIWADNSSVHPGAFVCSGATIVSSCIEECAYLGPNAVAFRAYVSGELRGELRCGSMERSSIIAGKVEGVSIGGNVRVPAGMVIQDRYPLVVRGLCRWSLLASDTSAAIGCLHKTREEWLSLTPEASLALYKYKVWDKHGEDEAHKMTAKDVALIRQVLCHYWGVE